MMMCRWLLVWAACITGAVRVAAQNPKHEFRGAWIATVENIDWPSRKGLSADVQQQEFIRLLDLLQSCGLNTVVVQVRPAADAFYPSPYEPWSEYLSGVQGVPPAPYYDPLQFMITETHRRGMEFHAWFNPYRAVFNINRSSVAANHPTRLFKDWFWVYGSDAEGYKKYFDPGNPDARRFVTDVIRDVVKRYDVDAIHFDDYFYPYRVAGKDFPDQASYLKYGSGLRKDVWRRSNCDSIIQMLSTAIKSTKPWVKFGISPFGIWRNLKDDPEGSQTNGTTNYDDLYADILLWLKRGWIDYVMPQLYWEIGHPKADYEELVDWWAAHNYGRHVYVGHGFYRAGSNSAWKDRMQLPRQIQMLRDYEDIEGSCFYSSKIFYKNPNGWNDTLRNNYYRHPALVPPMPWIDSMPPATPLVKQMGAVTLVMVDTSVHYKPSDSIGKAVKAFAVYAFPKNLPLDADNGAYLMKLFPGSAELALNEQFFALYPAQRIGVSIIDRNNNESKVVLVR
jgi:uncharacterized lipoprotein YddW (UPF0748 family)